MTKMDMARIEAQRRFIGAGLVKLSEATGISKSHLHRLLRGEAVCSEGQAKRILAALGRLAAGE